MFSFVVYTCVLNVHIHKYIVRVGVIKGVHVEDRVCVCVCVYEEESVCLCMRKRVYMCV